jgi:hypothetical protein
MKKIFARLYKLALVALAVMALAAVPAQATFIDVDAINATISNPQDTGINVTAGQALQITSSTDDTWSLGPVDPVKGTRDCNADGLPSGTWGQYTEGGQTFNYGAMVGRIADGPFFLVGTSYGPTTLTSSGRLYLVCWDSNYNDNSGFIKTNVIPLPASILLLGSGMLGLGLLGFRRRRD